ncbi:MAG: Flp family type IVb pilin [Planctomycetaceae bacterium]|nr:Flp family type IVb pilin [Planctomycetaceae bacterium]
MNTICQFLKNDEAATAVEYAVMLALIIGVMIATLQSFGGAAGGMWSKSREQLESHGF